MIYADNASTTKLSDKALHAMLTFLKEDYGNASNSYSFGVKSMRAVNKARSGIAAILNANTDEIFFTSGGSESNSWVLSAIDSGHIITTASEHHSVLNACRALEKRGVRVTYLPVNSSGVVSVDDVQNALCDDTKLVSILLANNEIGTIQPIPAIGKMLRSKKILFHTDAVQAVGHIPVDVQALGVDFLSASAHKFNGPKGTGLLYKREGIKLPPLIFGGKQEFGLRGGTENVAGIIGFHAALDESNELMEDESIKTRDLVATTFLHISQAIPKVILHGETSDKLPGIMNVAIPEVSGEAIMNILDLKGICVSTGSACTSGQNTPSHVLKAINLTDE